MSQTRNVSTLPVSKWARFAVIANTAVVGRGRDQRRFRGFYTFRAVPTQHRHRHFSDVTVVPQEKVFCVARCVGTVYFLPYCEIPPKYLLPIFWCKVAAVTTDLVSTEVIPIKASPSSGWFRPTCPPHPSLPHYSLRALQALLLS